MVEEDGRLKGERGRGGMREGKTDINMDRAEGSLFKPSCAVYTRLLNQKFLPASDGDSFGSSVFHIAEQIVFIFGIVNDRSGFFFFI